MSTADSPGSASPTSTADVPGTPSDNTTATAVQDAFAREGYDGALYARADAKVLCGTCREESDAGELPIGLQRRLEGSSDPDDMQLLVGATCPRCGAKGLLTLHYGPTASPEDQDVEMALQR